MRIIGLQNKQLLHRTVRLVSLLGFAALSMLVFVPSVRLELAAADPSQAFASGRVDHSLWSLTLYAATHGKELSGFVGYGSYEKIPLLIPALFFLCAAVGFALRIRLRVRWVGLLEFTAFLCGAVPVSALIFLVRLARTGVTAVFAPYLDRIRVNLGFTPAGLVLSSAILTVSLLCLLNAFLCIKPRHGVGNLK